MRPEASRTRASRPGLPTIYAQVEVLEELGSDAHVFFVVDAPPVTAEGLESAAEAVVAARPQALFTARVDARTAARVGADIELAVDVRASNTSTRRRGDAPVPQGAAELVAAPR